MSDAATFGRKGKGKVLGGKEENLPDHLKKPKKKKGGLCCCGGGKAEDDDEDESTTAAASTGAEDAPESKAAKKVAEAEAKAVKAAAAKEKKGNAKVFKEEVKAAKAAKKNGGNLTGNLRADATESSTEPVVPKIPKVAPRRNGKGMQKSDEKPKTLIAAPKVEDDYLGDFIEEPVPATGGNGDTVQSI